jgi:hypothetical protein
VLESLPSVVPHPYPSANVRGTTPKLSMRMHSRTSSRCTVPQLSLARIPAGSAAEVCYEVENTPD